MCLCSSNNAKHSCCKLWMLQIISGSTEMTAEPVVTPTAKLAKGDSNVPATGNRGSFKVVGEPLRVYGEENKAYTAEGMCFHSPKYLCV